MDNFYKEDELYIKMQEEIPAEFKLRLSMLVGRAIDYGITTLAKAMAKERKVVK